MCAHTHTLTQVRAHTLSVTRVRAHTHTHAHAPTHTIIIMSVSHAFAQTHSRARTLTRVRAHTHTHALARIHTIIIMSGSHLHPYRENATSSRIGVHRCRYVDYLLSLNCGSLRDEAYQQYILCVHTGKKTCQLEALALQTVLPITLGRWQWS